MKAHYGDIGIINIIRQRLKDIELQRWVSEITTPEKMQLSQFRIIRVFRNFLPEGLQVSFFSVSHS